jgi:hypothetical protein
MAWRRRCHVLQQNDFVGLMKSHEEELPAEDLVEHETVKTAVGV